MKTFVHSIVSALWDSMEGGHPARVAVASIQEGDVRDAVVSQKLDPVELVAFAERNLSESETYALLQNEAVVKDADDVRQLAKASRIDRRTRRLVFSDPSVYKTIPVEVQYDLVKSLDPGPGRDDFLLGVLPRWVGTDFEFDASEIAPTVGPFAGAYLLAATGPGSLSDDQAWDLITNPPQEWAHPDEERQWHQSRHLRDALKMVFTHRPELAERASKDPDLVQYAMQSPHWDPVYAHNIRGFDLGSGKLTDEATAYTPGLLLSLVWNPKTPLEQAEAIVKIAEDGKANTPHADSWKITASAAGRRIELQPWHVENYDDADEFDQRDRLTRRIESGLKKKVKPEEYLNGHESRFMLWWPKRFEEALALMTNQHITGMSRATFRNAVHSLGKHTTPVGTWSRAQAGADGPLPEMDLHTRRSWNRASVSYFATSAAAVTKAVKEFSSLPEADLVEAWSLFISLTEEDSVNQYEHVDTTMAILA